MFNVRWLWAGMLGGSMLLATPGHTSLGGAFGDVVGHFFSAALLASVPMVGYYFLYKRLGEKEATYIFGAAWAYLVVTQFLST